jgi:hypothetical protein
MGRAKSVVIGHPPGIFSLPMPADGHVRGGWQQLWAVMPPIHSSGKRAWFAPAQSCGTDLTVGLRLNRARHVERI